ncbi:MAG: STAS domain-containing protein [Candidatus Wallbacteria bacterium]|nr:STAS domain-containing protein [Candidatus Wallbacteria bacterium]
MKLSSEIKDGYAIVSIFEDIDFYNSEELEEELKKLLGKHNGLVISLKNVRYIDSSGLGILTGILRAAKEAGKKLILSELSHDVKNVFELTRLIDFFKIFEDTQEAIAALTGN